MISGVLTRSRGSFGEILEEADLLVELMGGIEPAREYLLEAIRTGTDVVSANKQLLSQHGEELFESAREHGVRLRFEAAVAGRFAITAHEFGAVADHDAPPRKHREITLLYLEVLPE